MTRPTVTMNYDIKVRLGDLAMVLLASMNKRVSVHDILVGGMGMAEWAPEAELLPEPSPIAGLLGGANWGSPIPVEGLKEEIDWE